MFERRMRPLIRDSPVEPAENAIGVLTPGRRNGCRGDRIFENQIPANDPGDKFAHGRVRVSVGAARNWNHRSEFRVTKTGEGAADARNDERKDYRWTRAISDRSSGANEQTGTDDPADSERDKVDPTERSFETVFAHLLGFVHQPIKRLFRE